MKAAQINQYGGKEVVEILDAPKPVPNEEKIVVQIKAAGVNPADFKMRQGYFAKMVPLQFPVTLGGDFSGVVSDVANGSEFKVGDEVYGQSSALTGGSGSFAEFALAPLKNIAIKPKNTSHSEAASLPLAGVSALQGLLEYIYLKEGQKILIQGGAGGIGTFAIQIAKHIGAYVYTTAKTEDVVYVKKLGADEVIDYTKEKFEDRVRDVDAVFDLVGGDTYTRSYQTLMKGGIIVSLLEELNQELMDKYEVNAITQFTQVTAPRLEKLCGLVEQGIVTTRVARMFPLDQTADALDCLEHEHPNGKVVVEI